MGFLKSIFGGGKSSVSEPPVSYKGFQIQPAPQQTNNGWSIEAIITLVKEDTELSHHFIRADVSSDRDSAVTLAVSKSQTMIDQLGEKLFSSK